MRIWTNHKKKIIAAVSTLSLGLLAVSAGTVYFLGSEDFRILATDNIVRAIEGRTGLATSLESFEIDFRNQTFALAGLVLRGDEDPSDPPLVSFERVEVGLRWNALIGGEVDLTSLEIVGPRLRIEIGDNGSTNIPPPPDQAEGAASDFEVSVGDLSVSDGQLSFNEERVDIDFTLSDLEGRFDYAEATRVLSGHIEYAGAVERLDKPAIPYELSTDFAYADGVALVQSMAVQSGESRLQLQGRIDEALRRRSGALEYTGTVGLDFMNHFFADEEFEGEMEVAGALEFSTTHFASSGRMTSPSLRFDRWSGENVSSDYSYGFPERVLVAENLAADVFDGNATGVMRLLPLPGLPRVELDLNYRDIDAEALRDMLPRGEEYVVSARVSGTMEGWFRGRFEDFDLSGDAAFEASPLENPVEGVYLPLDGSTGYRATPMQVEVEDLEGRLGLTNIEAVGVVRAEDFSLDVEMVSGDLRDLAFLGLDLSGSGTFDGLLSGEMSRPEAAGVFSLERYDLNGWMVDRIAGNVDFSGDRVSLENVNVFEGNSRVVLDGDLDLATRQPNLDVEVAALDPSDLDPFFSVPVAGAITGQLHVDSVEPVSASGTLSGVGLAYEDRPIGNAEAEVTLRGDTVQLRNARIRQDGAVLSGNLDYELGTGAIDIDLEASGQDLAQYRWLGVPEEFEGTVRDARFAVDGTVDSPLIAGQATIDGLRFRQQFFERSVVDMDHDGRVVRAEIAAGEQLRIDLDLNPFATGFPFDGNARFTNYDLSSTTGMDPGTVRVTGTAAFEGRLNDFETLDGFGEVVELTVHLEDADIVSPPFTFEFDTEEVELSSVDLTDETMSVTAEGAVSLAPGFPLDLTVSGDLDLSLLYPRYLDLDTTGTLAFRGNIVGELANPQLDGRATLDGVSIGHPSVFLNLTELNGEMAFDRDRVNLIDLQGSVGGGAVIVGGTIGVEGIRPGEMKLRVDASDVRIRTPEGLRTVFDATLSLGGTPEAPTLEGNVDVLSLSFGESFEEFLDLFEESTGGVLPSDAGPLDDLALAVHVQGERNINIENELVRVEARLDLDIGGTFGRPAMTGRVESVDGVLDLQGNRYLITRGNVDFVDPVGIEPRIDVQAETELRDYRVLLTLSGVGADIRLNTSSDPPLPETEILSLMAGGRTREELADNNGRGALPTSEELFQGAAATVLTDLLQERVGSRFGLGSRVRIDPFLVGAENDPVARLTISEQVTRDLIITYSQDLSSNRQEIILIEYFLDNNTSFIGSRDETGAVGLDIRLRKRFR